MRSDPNARDREVRETAGNKPKRVQPVALDSTYFKIVNLTSGKCIDIAANATENGTKVDLYTCNGTNAQLWFANNATGTPPSNPPPPPPPSGTKFVVYVDDWTGSWSTWATKIDFTKMKHLNLAFFTATTGNNWVDSSGQSDAAVKALVDKAHASGVKVPKASSSPRLSRNTWRRACRTPRCSRSTSSTS